MVDYLDTFLRSDDSEELRLRLVKLEKDGYTRGFAEGESYAVIGLAGAERKTIVARLRARATTEDLTADRWAQGGDDRMVSLHRKAAEVLRSEASGIEGGYTVDVSPEAAARVRERFGMK